MLAWQKTVVDQTTHADASVLGKTLTVPDVENVAGTAKVAGVAGRNGLAGDQTFDVEPAAAPL